MKFLDISNMECNMIHSYITSHRQTNFIVLNFMLILIQVTLCNSQFYTHNTQQQQISVNELKFGKNRDQNEKISISSLPQTLRVVEGSDVTLPCRVKNLGSHVIVWRKGHQVLSAGKMLLSRDTRMQLNLISTDNNDFKSKQDVVSGTELVLRSLKPTDAGDFVCQITTETNEALEVAHTLEILVPPHVKAQEGRVIVKSGNDVSLTCIASGNPVPTISWSRKNDVMPDGTVSGQSQNIFTVFKVDRYASGTYICEADNGVVVKDVVEQTISNRKSFNANNTASIHLQVLYEPEIEIARDKVHSGLGHEARLTCIVSGQPTPSVRWYKENELLLPSSISNNGQKLPNFGLVSHFSPKLIGDGSVGLSDDTMTPKAEYVMAHSPSSNRHTLIIKSLKSKNDFGNYSCTAENSLGISRRYIELHGRPASAIFHSATIPSPNSSSFQKHKSEIRRREKNRNKISHLLAWSVDSYAVIEEYRLLYRPLNNGYYNSYQNPYAHHKTHDGGQTSHSHRNKPKIEVQNEDVVLTNDLPSRDTKNTNNIFKSHQEMRYHDQQTTSVGYRSHNSFNNQQSDWVNVIIRESITPNGHSHSQSLQEDRLIENFHHEKAYLLKDLEFERQYECLVQARNVWGWSEPSKIFRFKTLSRKQRSEQRESDLFQMRKRKRQGSFMNDEASSMLSKTLDWPIGSTLTSSATSRSSIRMNGELVMFSTAIISLLLLAFIKTASCINPL